jgi:hypothetical protein
MEVRLLQQISGTRNGLNWPAPGTVVDLPDSEARDMVNSGLAADPGDETRTVMVPPDGVHVPGTTGWPDSVPLVEAPEDAVTDPEGAASAATAADRHESAMDVPVGTGTQHPSGLAMDREGVEKSVEVTEQHEAAAQNPIVVGGEKARKSAPRKATNAKGDDK